MSARDPRDKQALALLEAAGPHNALEALEVLTGFCESELKRRRRVAVPGSHITQAREVLRKVYKERALTREAEALHAKERAEYVSGLEHGANDRRCGTHTSYAEVSKSEQYAAGYRAGFLALEEPDPAEAERLISAERFEALKIEHAEALGVSADILGACKFHSSDFTCAACVPLGAPDGTLEDSEAERIAEARKLAAPREALEDWRAAYGWDTK